MLIKQFMALLVKLNNLVILVTLAPCGLHGCKNKPAPFLGQMS